TFFPRVVAPGPALFGRLDRLAVEDRRGWLGRPTRLLADPLAELLVQPLPRAVRLPLAEPVEHDVVWRQVVRQRTPRTAVAGDVQDRIDDLPLGVLRRTACRGVRRNPRLQTL